METVPGLGESSQFVSEDAAGVRKWNVSSSCGASVGHSEDLKLTRCLFCFLARLAAADATFLRACGIAPWEID